MTSKITVEANAGWPVAVTCIQSEWAKSTEIVPPDEERIFYVRSTVDLHIHEMQEEEAGLSSMLSMDFGAAIRAMKAGARVARKGWNGKGMWVCLSWLGGPKNVGANLFWSAHTKYFAETKGGVATVQPYFIMKTANDELQSGWLANQSDMLAEDWEVV